MPVYYYIINSLNLNAAWSEIFPAKSKKLACFLFLQTHNSGIEYWVLLWDSLLAKCLKQNSLRFEYLS